MSIKVMSYVWDHSPHSGSDLLMLLSIADHANDDGVAWPSVPRLAHRCRVTKRNAIYIIRRLEKAGSITIERGGGRGRASVYIVKGAVDCTLSAQTVQQPAPFTETVQPVAPFVSEKVQPVAPFTRERVKSSVIKGEAHCTPTIREPIKKDKPSPSYILPPGGEDGNEGAVKVKSPRAKKQHRCPTDYLPDQELYAWSREKFPDVDVDSELDKMRDWEFKVPHSDWSATLRNWIREAAKRQKVHGDSNSPLSPKGQRTFAASKRLLARYNGHDEPKPVRKVSRVLE